MNHYLVGDIGGTNARLGLVTAEGNEVFGIEQLSNKDYPDLLQVIHQYLNRAQCIVAPKKACFAVASPIVDDHVDFTNNSWSFSIKDLKARLGLEFLKVINDFEALARSLPYLTPNELLRIGGGEALHQHTKAVLGPGTGLGMAALVPAHPKPIPLATEGGHATFAPQDIEESFIAQRIKNRNGFCSNEDLLSGQGLCNIHQGLLEYHKASTVQLEAADITQLGLSGQDELCVRALDIFCAILGSVAGDYALQVGAQGGVFIAGGIAPRLRDFLAKSRFRQRFEAKGRFHTYLEGIQTSLIVAPQPGLIGAASFFDEPIPDSVAL